MQQITCPSCGARIPATSLFCHDCGGPVRVSEITFDEMSAADSILIQTENSTYSFSVIDPRSRRGTLSGGSADQHRWEATFVGLIPEGGGSTSADASRLRTAARALFYVAAEHGFMRLTTSVITNLIHIKTPQSQFRTTLF